MSGSVQEAGAACPSLPQRAPTRQEIQENLRIIRRYVG